MGVRDGGQAVVLAGVARYLQQPQQCRINNYSITQIIKLIFISQLRPTPTGSRSMASRRCGAVAVSSVVFASSRSTSVMYGSHKYVHEPARSLFLDTASEERGRTVAVASD